jgi:hypothetical protein
MNISKFIRFDGSTQDFLYSKAFQTASLPWENLIKKQQEAKQLGIKNDKN